MEEKCLWGIIDELRDDVNAHIDASTDMDAVNDTYQGEIFKLEADIKELKADNKRIRNTLVDNAKMFDGLQAENKTIKQCYEGSKVKVKVLQVDNDRLIKQVSSNRDSNSNTHTHTISGEIAEYMSHNDKCMGARMFLIPRDEFKHGEYDNTIYWDDGIE